MKSLVDLINSFDPAEANSEQLFDSVYAELKNLATAMMARESPGQTLQATALVHEMYMRLLTQLDNSDSPGDRNLPWPSRAAFFGAASESMRRILIDNARRRKRIKRGGNRERVELRADDLVCRIPPTIYLLLMKRYISWRIVILRKRMSLSFDTLPGCPLKRPLSRSIFQRQVSSGIGPSPKPGSPGKLPHPAKQQRISRFFPDN